MSQPYVGEIRMFGGNFAPAGWMFCAGQLLPISENDVLFNLIGTTYGGDGQVTFALPDLQGRVPVHQGQGQPSAYQIGEMAGAETVTLTANQIPVHTHPQLANSGIATQNSPAGNVLAASATTDVYVPGGPLALLNAGIVGPTGGSQPHDNMQPYVVVSFIISLYGIFPSQT
jgi:microcystin-dependent protein